MAFPLVRLFDVGRQSYSHVLELQKSLAAEVADGASDALVFCEHPPVVTLGRGTPAPPHFDNRQGLVIE